MGIAGLYGQWLIKGYKKAVLKNLPSDVSCLFMDMNGIFHGAAQIIYCYGNGDPENITKNPDLRKEQEERLVALPSKTDSQLELEMLEHIVIRIYEVITRIRPRDYVVLAVDGVAPMAKITQQRNRRYKKAKDSAESAKEGKVSRFDSNCITPGTEFMFKLSNYIEAFIAENIKANKFRFKNIIYSSHLVPGEGEHKIFDMVRKGHVDYDPSASHIVYGMDADLIMLTMLSSMSNIYLCRENFYDIVSIEILRDEIYKNMTLQNGMEKENVIRDFVLMLYLIGNDFLPHMVSFDDLNSTINLMFRIYQDLEKYLTDDMGHILWLNFREFIHQMARRENDLLVKIASKTYDNPFYTLDNATTITVDPETDERHVRVDYDKFRGLWYDKALKPHTEIGREMIPVINDNSRVKDMCLEYFKGFQWVLRYYMYGHKSVSSRFVYIYHYSPLLTDMDRVLSQMIDFGEMANLPTFENVGFSIEDPVLTPVHQLICVMPPSSWNLIPLPYRFLMSTRFQDISPSTFKTELEGKSDRQRWQEIALLSIVDPKRVIIDTADYPVPDKYMEEAPKFVRVVRNPRAPQAFTTLGSIEKYEQLEASKGLFIAEEPVLELEDLQVPIVAPPIFAKEKVFPKSPAQIDRVVEQRVKNIQRKKQEKKESFIPDARFTWQQQNLL